EKEEAVLQIPLSLTVDVGERGPRLPASTRRATPAGVGQRRGQSLEQEIRRRDRGAACHAAASRSGVQAARSPEATPRAAVPRSSATSGAAIIGGSAPAVVPCVPACSPGGIDGDRVDLGY
ncbi:unnamed protein product, partial [Urochloa humidicola]